MATKVQRARKSRTVQVGEDAGDNTRERILDVAEELFAANGIENVTLREVTAAAGVNLAAVHYHLGSRDELMRAILSRRMTPLLDERLRRLATLPADASREAKVEHIVRSFVEPSMNYDCSTDNYLIHRLLTRLAIYEERNPTDLFQFVLADTHAKFIDALGLALPELDKQRLGYRFEFMLGLVTHATALRAKLGGATQPVHGITQPERLVDELITSIVDIFVA